MKVYKLFALVGFCLLLGACASPERKLADARQVFDANQFVARCTDQLDRRNNIYSRTQIRQSCRCTQNGFVRHYRTPERLAQTTRREFNRVSASVTQRCTNQLKRKR